MKNGWYAFGLLLAACAGAVAEPIFVPPAAASSQVQRWDYYCEVAYGPDNVMDMAKKAGAEGWEMVNVGGGTGNKTYCFKRPL